MDVIYANQSGTDVGVLLHFTLDAEIGRRNTFEVKISLDDNVLDGMKYVYSENTEYGGIIESTRIDTGNRVATYTGITWRGILEDYILEPDAGDDYLTVSGDANTILGTLITRIGQDATFEASTATSDITVSSYQFERYVDAYTGINRMLIENDAKLILTWEDGKVQISAEAITDYADENEVNTDQAEFTIEKTTRNYNHVIGLGDGDLSAKTVIDRYLDENGDISTTQYYTGLDEKVIVFNYPNAESEADLIEQASQKLLDSAISDKMELETNDLEFDIGDKITATDIETGLSVTQTVRYKVITIEDGIVYIDYEIGDIII